MAKIPVLSLRDLAEGIAALLGREHASVSADPPTNGTKLADNCGEFDKLRAEHDDAILRKWLRDNGFDDAPRPDMLDTAGAEWAGAHFVLFADPPPSYGSEPPLLFKDWQPAAMPEAPEAGGAIAFWQTAEFPGVRWAKALEVWPDMGTARIEYPMDCPRNVTTVAVLPNTRSTQSLIQHLVGLKNRRERQLKAVRDTNFAVAQNLLREHGITLEVKA